MTGPAGRLAGKVAVITGGASGMGLASVETFVREGARVVFCDLPPASGAELEQRLGATKTRLHHTRRQVGGPHDGAEIAKRLGPAATFVPADVTDTAALEHVVDVAFEQHGRLDIMFNNAGVGGNEGHIVDSPVEVFERVVEVNLKAVWWGIKLAARKMIGHGGGSIISTSSTAAVGAYPGLGAYSGAKAGMVQMSRVAAVELAPHLIRVNCICPGRILTPLIYDSPMRDAPVDPATLEEQYRNGQPLPLVGESQDIADAALWLASDESRFVTGQAIVVDGGAMIEADPLLRGRTVSTTGAGFSTDDRPAPAR